MLHFIPLSSYSAYGPFLANNIDVRVLETNFQYQ